jgi:N-acetylmuramic acid 6-phosphate etherase
MVQGVIAGGDTALRQAVEHAEDDADAGAIEIDQRDIGPRDVVFGISAGGTTPYVHGALRRARERGAKTVFFACVPAETVADAADVNIRVLTGPEVITGSTRLKAGIATKMTLNMISTLAMVQLGKVFGNLMVDVNALGCAKLTDRAIRIVVAATGIDRAAAAQLLESASWRVKTAIVMQRCGLRRDAAEQHLAACSQNLRRALEQAE